MFQDDQEPTPLDREADQQEIRYLLIQAINVAESGYLPTRKQLDKWKAAINQQENDR